MFDSDLAVSFEGVRRIDVSGKGDTERLAGIIEYELPESTLLGDGKYLTATFGQDFDDESKDSRTIVLLGINFSFGKNPKILDPSS